MIGKCFACGKPIDLDTEAICSEECLRQYEADLQDLRSIARNPQTVRQCVGLLETARQLPIVELARA
jgi:Uncharacterized protein containing a Zn-ribbon (DUF2116)